jgi:hypothetical protein
VQTQAEQAKGYDQGNRSGQTAKQLHEILHRWR